MLASGGAILYRYHQAQPHPLRGQPDWPCPPDNAVGSYPMSLLPSFPRHNDPEPLRVLHIGDSHLQAGMLSQRLRSMLSELMDEEVQSEGYVFPYNIVGTNSPAAYTFETNALWRTKKVTTAGPIEAGLAGICMETNTPGATIGPKLTAHADPKSMFDRITLFSPIDTGSFVPTIADSLLLAVRHDHHMWTFQLRRPVRQLNITLRQQNPTQTRFVLAGVLLEHSKSRLVYSSAGLNGASCATFLRARQLAAQASALKPQLIIVSLGTNDAYTNAFAASTFSTNLDSLVLRLRAAQPHAAVLLTTPGDHFWMQERSNPNLEAVRRAIEHCAEQHGCLTWDLFGLMGGAGSMAQWFEQGWAAPDLVHLTPQGYRRQAEMMYCALYLLITSNTPQ
ncbi:MAG: hypothetical protein IJU72_07180 [Bacteroidales bacterium]|nr:hypothetical protein [Bacteroidales bacterium]